MKQFLLEHLRFGQGQLDDALHRNLWSLSNLSDLTARFDLSNRLLTVGYEWNKLMGSEPINIILMLLNEKEQPAKYLQKLGRSLHSVTLLLCFILPSALSGCSRDSLDKKIVFGTIVCGDEEVECGHVRFVPIEGTSGPATTGTIEDGAYRLENRGGVPVGKHRVEVIARRKTGKKITRENRFGDEEEIAEELAIGPIAYEGKQSPLVKEVTRESDGKIDIEIPADPRGPRPGN